MFGKKRLKNIINQQEKLIQRKDETLSHFNKQMMINRGNAVLSAPLTNGELYRCFHEEVSWWDNYTDDELYDMLCRAKEYLDSAEVLNASYMNFSEWEIQQNRPLSFRQISRVLVTMEWILRNEYNHAMHELQDCIANYHNISVLDNIFISVNEHTIYKCLIDTFIHQIKDQKENT